jgi:hypothetical protein
MPFPESPVAMKFMQSVALNPQLDLNGSPLRADNKVILSLPNDNGYDGTIGLSNLDKAYEIANGYAMALSAGHATVNAVKFKKHCIYFETVGVYDDGDVFMIKNWLLNVVTAKPGKNYVTKGENIEFGAYEVPIKIYGVPVMDAAGTAEYVDEAGMRRTAYMISSIPTDTGYATFGDTVPVVKMASAG